MPVEKDMTDQREDEDYKGMKGKIKVIVSCS